MVDLEKEIEEYSIYSEMMKSKNSIIELMTEDSFYRAKIELDKLIKLIEDNVDPYYTKRFPDKKKKE